MSELLSCAAYFRLLSELNTRSTMLAIAVVCLEAMECAAGVVVLVACGRLCIAGRADIVTMLEAKPPPVAPRRLLPVPLTPRLYWLARSREPRRIWACSYDNWRMRLFGLGYATRGASAMERI